MQGFFRINQKRILPQGFIKYNGRRIAQVQGALLFSHRDADGRIRMGFQDLWPQPCRLFAKDQKVSVSVCHIAVAPLCMGGGIKESPMRILDP